MSYALATLGQATTTTPVRDQAQLLYANGQTFFRAGNYTAALNAFQQAYHTIPDPVVLIAIGQTFERLSRWDDALAQYREYLLADPSGPHAVVAHERIATLTAPVKEPSGAPVVPAPAAVPSATITAPASSGAPRVSGTVIAVSVGLLAIAGVAIAWRMRRAPKPNPRRVKRRRARRTRRNTRRWQHDTDYALALRDLERSRAKLHTRL